MDSTHRGHPQRPLHRNELPLEQLVDSFLEETAKEDPTLAKHLERLDENGRRELGGILGRFDFKAQGSLEPQHRLFARRVLGRLHRIENDSLTLTNKILDYLDLNTNAILEASEVEFIVEILEMFSKAESVNETLSYRELQMLYAVLRHLDGNDDHRLDKLELEQLHDGLRVPEAFLARQKRDNPLLAQLFDDNG